MENQFAVQVSALTFAFSEGRSRQNVIQKLSFDVFPGEIFVVVGPSGSGKSTLLKLIANLLPAPRETIVFNPPGPRIAMTFQRSGLFDSLNCGDNLRFPIRECLKLTPAETETLVQRALADVGLSGTEDLRLNQISGGMQKRVGIARGLVLKPQLMLYDDPTAGLDPLTTRSISELIVSTTKKYLMTAVVVTSDLNLAYEIADRIGFLFNGKFQQIGTREEIKSSKDPVVHQFVNGLAQGPLTAGFL
jgi:phospholipid/cholesterol/gamma-HCH transport system ATP-binding protein